MARKKNSTFQGVSVYDIDVDSPSFRRSIENVAGDVALIYDKLTGENAETNTITHVGGGRGAPLGVPLVNQYIGRSLGMTNPSAKDTSGGIGRTIVLPYIINVPTGESDLAVRVWVDQPDANYVYAADWTAELRSMSNVTSDTITMSHTLESSGLFRLSANFTGLSTGLQLLFVSLDTDRLNTYFNSISSTLGLADLGRIVSCSVYRPGRRPGSVKVQENDTNVYGVTTPSAAQGVVVPNFDASMFVGANLLDPIDGYTTATLNRSINGLMEYVTGWPCGLGGNATYTHVDHDGAGAADDSNPARSRFFAHTRSLYASEPEPKLFPLWAECFGAFLDSGKFAVDLAEPPTLGMLGWYAPWPITTATFYMANAKIQFPDFQSTSSNLNVAVLLGSEGNAAVSNWTVYANTTSGSASSAVVALDASNDYWYGFISGVPFTGDANDYINIGTSRSGVKSGIGEVCILSAYAYFEP